jgi:hypothetical protein
MEGSKGAADSGGAVDNDLGAFAVFDPDAGDAGAGGSSAGPSSAATSTGFPSLMSLEAVDRVVEARSRSEQGLARGKERPDPGQ